MRPVRVFQILYIYMQWKKWQTEYYNANLEKKSQLLN